MSVPSQNIPIKFGGGVDTKSDPKVVKAGKLLRLQDAVQIAAGEWRKRPGGVPMTNAVLGGGTVTSPRLLTTFKNELVCADSALGQLLSYSPTQNLWVPKGNYSPVQLSNTIVSRFYASTASTGHLGATSAAIGNLAVFAWLSRAGASSLVCPMASIIDLSTGASILSDVVLQSTTNSTIQCVVIGGTTLGVIFSFSTAIYLCTVSVSSGAPSFSAPILLITDTVNSFLSVVGTATGAALVYGNATSIVVATFNSAGTITHTATVATATTSTASVVVSSESTTGNIWVYWNDTTTLRYAVYSSTLSSVLAATNIGTTAANASHLVAAEVSSGIEKLIYGVMGLSANEDTLYTTNIVQAQSSGTVGSSAVLAQGVLPISKVFTINSVQYFNCLYQSQAQGTYFTLKVSDGSILAKALQGAADPFPRDPSNPIQLSASKVIIPVAEAYEVIAINGSVTQLTGTNFITLDAGSTETFQTLEANGNLLLNGGQVSAYDGKSVNEAGFHLFPCIMSATPSSSGGLIGVGTFLYYATYHYVDEQGNIYESAPSLPVSVVQASGSSNSCALVISSLGMTAKPAAQIYLYRTQANQTTPKLIARVNNSASTSTVTIVDATADSALTSSTPLYASGVYASGGGVLSNQAPPAAVAMVSHNNRVWLIPSENPKQIWYCQTLTPTAGINFSSNLLIDVDASGGDCVALAGLDANLVVFAQKFPFVMSGDGLNAVGQGSTLSNLQPIPSDAGCVSQKSVLVFSQGVLRKTAKGLYLLDRKLGDSYFGIDVEGFNSQGISASTIVAGNTHLRFLTASGLSLNYDYVFQQWSTFTNYQGYASTNWNGVYFYARTDGSIYQETPGYYLDNTTPYAPLARVPWLAFAGVQGFQRVREFLMLGAYANGASASHGIQVSAAYDFVESFSTPIPYLFGAANTSGPLQYREGLPRQKCDAISLIIQEITTGDSAEYISFTDMSFDAGVKRGLNKLPKTRSVG